MRNAPPISTISPRETITSRPAASVLSTSTVAAALLLTTSAASAPACPPRRRERLEEALDVVLALGAAAGAEVRLQVGEAAGDLGERLLRGVRERRAAEVGVEQHAGGVDRAAQAARGGAFEDLGGARRDGVRARVHRAFARQKPRARLGHRLARGLQGQRMRRRNRRHPRMDEQVVHARQLPQRARIPPAFGLPPTLFIHHQDTEQVAAVPQPTKAPRTKDESVFNHG